MASQRLKPLLQALQAFNGRGMAWVLRHGISPSGAAILPDQEAVDQFHWRPLGQDAQADHLVVLLDVDRHQGRCLADRDLFE